MKLAKKKHPPFPALRTAADTQKYTTQSYHATEPYHTTFGNKETFLYENPITTTTTVSLGYVLPLSLKTAKSRHRRWTFLFWARTTPTRWADTRTTLVLSARQTDSNDVKFSQLCVHYRYEINESKNKIQENSLVKYSSLFLHIFPSALPQKKVSSLRFVAHTHPLLRWCFHAR